METKVALTRGQFIACSLRASPMLSSGNRTALTPEDPVGRPARTPNE